MSKHIDKLISFEYVDDGWSEEVFAFRINRPMTNEEVLKEYEDLNLSGNLCTATIDACFDCEELDGSSVASILEGSDGKLDYAIVKCSHQTSWDLLVEAAGGECAWPEGTWFVGSIFLV